MTETSADSPTRFARVLGRRDVLALSFGAMVGWGWVVLAGVQVESAGSYGAPLAFLLGGLAVVLVGLTYAELASAMPVTGGEHVYSYRALGVGFSFVCTWAILLGYVSVVAFEAVALPTVLEVLFPGYSVGHLWTVAGWDVEATWVAVGVGAALVMTALNVVGVKLSARVQGVLTMGLLLAGILLLVSSGASGTVANLEPRFAGTAGLLGVLVMVPFLFVGFDVIPQAAEEIDLPRAALGRVLVASVGFAVVWYVAVVLAVAYALPSAARRTTELATADAVAASVGSPWGARLLVVGGLCGILTSWNSFLVGGSRALYALAHARMVPAWFGALHPRWKTPHRAVIAIGLLSALAPLFGRKALVWLVDAGGLGIVVAYAAVAVSFVVLRHREPTMPRPFRAPLGGVLGPVTIVLSLALLALYLPGSPSALVWPHEWIVVLVWIALGAALFVWARVRYGVRAARGVLDAEIARLPQRSEA